MQHRNNAHWRGLFLFEFLLIILIILLGYWSKHCPLRHFWFLVRIPVSGIAISTMSTKIKGIYKSLKYITQLFVVKEREIEIGYPTDVKHVAHIGWDGPSGSGPSWMSEFKTAPDFSTSLGNLDDRRDPNPLSTTIMPPQDNAESSQASSSAINDTQSHEQPRVPKKNKRKKTKLGSAKSPLTPFSSSLKQSKTAKPKTNTYNEMEAPSPVVKV